MDIDLSKFPEMNTFSSVIRYSLCLEEAIELFYREAAGKSRDLAEALTSLAEAHNKRYKLLEETRQQKLNEMILEPISGLERDKYLPEVDPINESAIVQQAMAVEDKAGVFYEELSKTANELSREAAKVYKRMAKENGKLKAKLEKLG
jgi:hypothetical protein